MSFNTTIKKKKKIKSGFTLIEIILALVVILLISSLLVQIFQVPKRTLNF